MGTSGNLAVLYVFLQPDQVNIAVFLWSFVIRDCVRYCTVASLFTRYQNSTAMINCSPCTSSYPAPGSPAQTTGSLH